MDYIENLYYNTVIRTYKNEELNNKYNFYIFLDKRFLNKKDLNNLTKFFTFFLFTEDIDIREDLYWVIIKHKYNIKKYNLYKELLEKNIIFTVEKFSRRKF